jgi:hypothetical protein
MIRKCDLTTPAGRIHHALKELHAVWHQHTIEWNDAVSRRFRDEHLEPMIPQVKLALDAISRMSLLIDEVERDCEE